MVRGYYYFIGRIEKISLVYKAFKDEFGLNLICFSCCVEMWERVHMINGDIIPESSQVYIVRSDKVPNIAIPSNFRINSVDKGIRINNYDGDLDSIIKDMVPDMVFDLTPIIDGILYKDKGNWLMYCCNDGSYKPLCTTVKDFTDNLWSIEKYALHYREENKVAVYKSYYKDYKEDIEYTDLLLNVDTGTCIYSYKKFEVGEMTECVSRFNRKYRFWECIYKKNDYEIADVKRLGGNRVVEEAS